MVEQPALDEQSTDSELRQAQKLASVGMLAAGVAHEINTPVQFIGDNLRFLADSVEMLIQLVDHLQAAPSETAAAGAWAEWVEGIRGEANAADFDFLKEEVPEALAQARSGVERIAAIVRAMKAFAQPDGQEASAVDINAALDNTIAVARNEIKYVADVDTDFSDIPHVKCFGGEIKSAFLNLLVNAARAIEDTKTRGTISVRTRRDLDSVIISISDTGAGIRDEMQAKVFDQVLTANGDAKATTGQGLAVARSMIHRHRGHIWFETAAGMGTTFYVRLPLNFERTGATSERHDQ